jgi:hypothetical protein
MTSPVKHFMELEGSSPSSEAAVQSNHCIATIHASNEDTAGMKNISMQIPLV